MRDAALKQILLTTLASGFTFGLLVVLTSVDEASVYSYFLLWIINGLMGFGLLVLTGYSFFKSGVTAEFRKFLARLLVHTGASLFIMLFITFMFADAIE